MTHHTDAEQLHQLLELVLTELDRKAIPIAYMQEIDRKGKAFIEQAARRAPAVPATHEPPFWFPHLRDRADGVAGHYSIARRNPGKNFLEYISPLGNWVGYGAQVFSLEEAQEWMKNSALAAAPIHQLATQACNPSLQPIQRLCRCRSQSKQYVTGAMPMQTQKVTSISWVTEW